MSAGDESTDDLSTGELRALQETRNEEEAQRADDARTEAEERKHGRRADKAAYLAEKLDEQAETLGEDSGPPTIA